MDSPSALRSLLAALRLAPARHKRCYGHLPRLPAYAGTGEDSVSFLPIIRASNAAPTATKPAMTKD